LTFLVKCSIFNTAMSSYIDLKFINDVSSRLSQFKKKT